MGELAPMTRLYDMITRKHKHAFQTYTPFTRSSKHRANVEQMYSKYTC